jgi:hypothetical protein
MDGDCHIPIVVLDSYSSEKHSLRQGASICHAAIWAVEVWLRTKAAKRLMVVNTVLQQIMQSEPAHAEPPTDLLRSVGYRHQMRQHASISMSAQLSSLKLCVPMQTLSGVS